MYKQVIVFRNDLKLGKGKIAAQVAHAAVDAYILTLKKNPVSAEKWLSEGQKKVILKINSKQEILELFQDIKNIFPTVLIKDAAHTQLPAPDITCIGIGPIKETEIDRFTKKYSLL
jgi:PTH2 family peptidyl-tRNA hydrolase